MSKFVLTAIAILGIITLLVIAVLTAFKNSKSGVKLQKTPYYGIAIAIVCGLAYLLYVNFWGTSNEEQNISSQVSFETCSNADIQSAGLSAEITKLKIRFMAPVYKGLPPYKPFTTVGLTLVYGEKCTPMFVRAKSGETFTDISGYSLHGAEPCSMDGVAGNLAEIVRRANKKFEGWQPIGNAFNNPEHYLERWSVRWDKKICDTLPVIKNVGCVGSCVDLIKSSKGGVSEFCTNILPYILEKEPDSNCKACCP